MTNFLTLVEVLTIHADQIARYGGSTGVRDLGLVEAALFRPQLGYYEETLEQAAALWESLSQNHPFVDGNKRTAFASMEVFLRFNRWTLSVTETEAYDFVHDLYESNSFRYENLLAWLKVNARLSKHR